MGYAYIAPPCLDSIIRITGLDNGENTLPLPKQLVKGFVECFADFDTKAYAGIVIS